jgi:hypothetical protein
MISPVEIGNALPITIKQARKLLGKDFADFSDEKVEQVIVLLDAIAQDSVTNSSKI